MIDQFLCLLLIEWLLRRIFRTGAHTRGWFVGRKRRRARKQTEQALLKLAEGDYQQVEKLMAKNADHAEQPVVNYLLAAEAAQQRGDEARANQHLERAAELAGNDTIPVEITRVRLQLAFLSGADARRGSGGDCAAFIDGRKATLQYCFHPGDSRHYVWRTVYVATGLICTFPSPLFIIQTVTNNEIMFCTPWVYVTMDKCGTFARVVAVSPTEDVESSSDAWDDDAVFQGAGWVN